MSILFCIVFNLFYFLPTINGQFFGPDPVRFDVGEITNCDKNSLWIWNLHIKAINDSHVAVNFNGTINSNFDNSITVQLEFFQLNSKQEWKRVIKVAKKKACMFIRTISGDLFVHIGKELGLADPKCPVPKGFYHLENRLIDVQSTIFGKFLVGKFKALVQGFTAKKETLFCGEGFFTTTKI